MNYGAESKKSLIGSGASTSNGKEAGMDGGKTWNQGIAKMSCLIVIVGSNGISSASLLVFLFDCFVQVILTWDQAQHGSFNMEDR